MKKYNGLTPEEANGIDEVLFILRPKTDKQNELDSDVLANLCEDYFRNEHNTELKLIRRSRYGFDLLYACPTKEAFESAFSTELIKSSLEQQIYREQLENGVVVRDVNDLELNTPRNPVNTIGYFPKRPMIIPKQLEEYVGLVGLEKYGSVNRDV